jgi:tellurite resistance protein TerC
LILIEVTDLIFAADSIPAMSITQDHFIVYTSNVFAILGLRSLYFFALAGMMDKFSICLRDLL